MKKDIPSDTGLTRRQLLKCFGRLACANALFTGLEPLGAFAMSANPRRRVPIPSIKASDEDELVLAPDMAYQVLLSWGDRLNQQGERFGFNNDFIAVVPIAGRQDDLLMWVNHEYTGDTYTAVPREADKKSIVHVDQEMKELGGSIFRVRQSGSGWRLVGNDPYNRRIDATTPIPLSSARPIMGETTAIGTFANCAGGVTPWQSILSCEENYDDFYGEVDYRTGKRIRVGRGEFGWGRFYDRPPEHYGWVVELDPFSGEAKKLSALGRFAHESATVVQAADGRCVVYMGDDKANQCIYKFIAAEQGTLEQGSLYVADTRAGHWRPLDVRRDRRLGEAFSDQTELLINTREAARLVGGTPQDRPEGIAVDPVNSSVYISLTKGAARPYGAILKIVEQGGDPLALRFKADVFLLGGEDSGFACPDNLVFDPKGDLWVTTDVSSGSLNKPPYKRFKNNGLFYIPLSGEQAGRPFQIASAPVGAELTGPCFSPDGHSLFLSVQHPGEGSADPYHPNSHWPDGGKAMPRPSVVSLRGAFF